MELYFGGIVLRDYRMSDVDDEIRWTNEDTAWITADTPWLTVEPVDPEELRADMERIIAGRPEDAIRWRLELEVDGKHIGMLSSYFLTEQFEYPPWESIDQRKNAPENGMIRALGIEICEPEYWNRGIGTKALTAFMEYYRRLGEDRFWLETWSGNLRMQGCAKKLGFVELLRKTSEHLVDGNPCEDLILEKRF